MQVESKNVCVFQDEVVDQEFIEKEAKLRQSKIRTLEERVEILYSELLELQNQLSNIEKENMHYKSTLVKFVKTNQYIEKFTTAFENRGKKLGSFKEGTSVVRKVSLLKKKVENSMVSGFIWCRVEVNR